MTTSLTYTDEVKETKQAIVDREVRKLADKLGRQPTDEELLVAATPKSHPLHAYYEWDDTIAGHKYRLEQSHVMLMSLKFIVHELQARDRAPIRVRKLLVVTRGEPMRLRNEALAERDSREIIIANAKEELRIWCRRWPDIPELAPLRTMLEKTLK
jgi:hypothetical protein